MTVTFLGTGTSQGVPVIACTCAVCKSTDPHDKRLRSSILLEINGKNIVIDTGPDFRYQMLRARVQHLEAILYTHAHKDHIAGLDDIRAFNYFQGTPIDVYADQPVQEALKREFYYIFASRNFPGIPQIHLFDIDETPFYVGDILVTPLLIWHHQLPIKGFRIGDFTYLTDAKSVPDSTLKKIEGTKILVVNALQREPHISHFTLDEAIGFAQKVGAAKTYLTHVSHRLGLHKEVQLELPPNVALAYDGLVVSV